MKPKGRYGWISKYYDLVDFPCEYFFYRHMRYYYLNKLRNQRILEVGIGTGKNLPYYHKSNTVIGIDRNPQMLSLAKKRQKEFHHLYLKHSPPYPLSDNSIDVAVVTFVLFTTEQAGTIAEELTRVVRPQGRVIIFEYRPPHHKLAYYVLAAFSTILESIFGLNFTNITTPELFSDKFSVIHYKEWISQLLYAIILKKEEFH